jgi:hypothetical protein
VSIWESEFLEHRVPPVCVKSGQPAAGTWTQLFAPPGQTAILGRAGTMRVRLPLSRGWLTRLAILIAVRAVGLAVALPFLLILLFLPSPPSAARPLVYAGLFVGAIAGTWMWLAQPKGSVHRLPTGQAWLLLVGAHPAFVDAVNRSRAAGAAVFSADRKQWWDGSRWVSNDMPERWWLAQMNTYDKRWQFIVGALVVFLVGSVAWWSFHR